MKALFRREVLPHADDARIDTTKTLVGYEISFTRYFHKPVALRSLTESRTDILALEHEGRGLLQSIVAGD